MRSNGIGNSPRGSESDGLVVGAVLGGDLLEDMKPLIRPFQLPELPEEPKDLEGGRDVSDPARRPDSGQAKVFDHDIFFR